jgi:hypothetical protein
VRSIVSVVEDINVLAASSCTQRMRKQVQQLDDEIAAIVGFVELALRGAGEDQELISDLHEIRGAAIRAVEKTRALRVKTPKLTLVP